MVANANPLQNVIDRIVIAAHPLKIILFGSAVRGQAGADSDLDLLIVMPEGTHRRRTAQRLYSALSGVGVPVDLLVATPGDLSSHADNIGLIYHHILKEGKTVYAA
jgi:predicted nucleotidyltransferase